MLSRIFYINYGILICGKSGCKTYLDKILKLQKWAVRSISNIHYRCHSAPLFKKYNILNVYGTYNLEVGAFMYQYYKNVLPVSFKHFFSKRSDIHDYHTRNKSDYNITRNKKAFTDRTVRTTGPILWN